jgi:Helicase conserved C-terminal domain
VTESAPRQLLRWLRSIDDDHFAAFLTKRPDLVSPLPVDMDQLAYRACTSSSLIRLLGRLNKAQITVLEALDKLGQDVTEEAVAEAIGARTAGVDLAELLAGLRDYGLVFGERRLSWPPELSGYLSPFAPRAQSAHSLLYAYPLSRLERIGDDIGAPRHVPDQAPALNRMRQLVGRISAVLSVPDEVNRLLDEAGPQARALAGQLSGPGSSRIAVPGEFPTIETADTPVEALLARALIVETDPGEVTVPVEVGRALLSGPLSDPAALVRPELPGVTRDPALIDRTAVGAAIEFVGTVEQLLDAWAEQPAAPLRSGGIGQRELRRVGATLGVDDQHAAMVIEVAEAARLVTWDPSGRRPGWQPTEEARSFAERDLPDRWWLLAQAWVTSSRDSARVGDRDETGKLRAALSDGTWGWDMADLRRTVLGLLAEGEPGFCPDPSVMGAQVRWLRPRRPPERDDALEAAAVLTDAARIGLTAFGGIGTAGRVLLTTGIADQSVLDLFPQPTDQVLIQGDLTAVAPGPLTPAAAHVMRSIADVESRGSATVYRFSTGSIRRAFESGHRATELHALLAEYAATPVPQPLSYLIDDEARRFGNLAVGSARSFVRSLDPDGLAAILTDPQAADLMLTEVDHNVAVSPVKPSYLLDRLRALGHGVSDIDANGGAPRRRSARPPSTDEARLPPADQRVADAVARLRAGDRRIEPTARPGRSDEEVADSVLADLWRRIKTGRPSWIRHYDDAGDIQETLLMPLKIEDGRLFGYDAQNRHQRIPLHRIAGLERQD